MLRLLTMVTVSGLVLCAPDAEATLISCHNYGPRSRTAGWRTPNPHGHLIVAHKHLPFGTIVRFSNSRASVDLIVKDRGPYKGRREYDIDCKAMQRLGINGVGHVKTEIIRH